EKQIDYNSRYCLVASADNSFNYFALDPHDGLILSMLNSYYNLLCSGAKAISYATNVNKYINEEKSEINFFQISEFEKAKSFLESFLGLQQAAAEDKKLISQNEYITACFGVKDKIGPNNLSRKANDGDYIVIFGETEPEFDGSTWAELKIEKKANRGKKFLLGGLPPALREFEILKISELIKSVLLYNKSVNAFSVGAGGLASALWKIAELSNAELKIDLSSLFENRMSYFDILLSESSNRFLATMNKESLQDLHIISRGSGVKYTIIGRVNESKKAQIEINGLGTINNIDKSKNVTKK
ncbi:MAG: hypothetical protein LBB07_03325, partial [Bifidobacteriaceae bacterium]|nr:hypothetical protein [Bifidobacteriaceae bacterium]